MSTSRDLLRLALALALGFSWGCGLLTACFTPPSDDVLFSCELEGDDQCPPDYQCEADNCCHRVGSDVDANLGSCALSGNSGGTGTGDTGTGDTGTSTGGDTETSTETG